MRKTLLFTILFVCSSAIFAQTNDNSYPKGEIQLEIGEATQMIIGERLTNLNAGSGMLSNYSSPAISITYHRNINNRFWYGVSASFKQAFTYGYPQYTGGEDSKEIGNIFAFMPSLKFAYYNSDKLQMYSSIQAGFCFLAGKPLYGFTNANGYSAKVGLFGQLTGFGIRYGKDFFIGTELGYGSKGIINFIAGYKF